MELTSFDQSCLELLEASPRTQSRDSMRSAINHLRRAKVLLPVDCPMAGLSLLYGRGRGRVSSDALLKRTTICERGASEPEES